MSISKKRVFCFLVFSFSCVGTLSYARDYVSEQTLALIVSINTDVVAIQQSFLKPIRFHKLIYDGNYHYTLLDDSQNELFTGNFSNPFTYYDVEEVAASSVTFNLKVPYLLNAVSIHLERNDASLGVISLGTVPLPER